MNNFNTMRWMEAQRICESWEIKLRQGKYPIEQSTIRLDGYHLEMRNRINEIYLKHKDKGNTYEFDSEFGLELYDYFTNTLGMTEAEAANDEIWIYIQVAVVPEIVLSRWGMKEDKFNHSRFWSKTQRIYLKVIWWYIHMIWDGSIESTKKYLAPVDISQIIDRSGKNGTRLNVYREILQTYASVPKSNRKGLIGKVLMLNATYCSVLEPELMDCSLNDYVKGLYKELGVDV